MLLTFSDNFALIIFLTVSTFVSHFFLIDLKGLNAGFRPEGYETLGFVKGIIIIWPAERPVSQGRHLMEYVVDIIQNWKLLS
jgi:hypothetical protein